MAGAVPMPSTGSMKASSAMPGTVCSRPTPRVTGSAQRERLSATPPLTPTRIAAGQRHPGQPQMARAHGGDEPRRRSHR